MIANSRKEREKHGKFENQKARKAQGVKLWEVAERVGITDAYFSKKLRRELPETEQDEILGYIDEIAEGRRAQNASN